MKRFKFLAVMEIKNTYSQLLQVLDHSKWDVWDNSKIYGKLSEIAFNLAREL